MDEGLEEVDAVFAGGGDVAAAVLAEQNDEWTEQRRYIGSEILAACQKAGQETDTNDDEVTIGAIALE